MQFEISRRSFLQHGTFAMLALKVTRIANARATINALFHNADGKVVQNQLLSLVNDERAAAGKGSLKLDELACNVAQEHAIEMAENGFLSHWGLDGLKPYHRYSFAGGTEAIEENEGGIDHGAAVPEDEITSDVAALHKAMHDEYRPNDGHRRTILAPQHTHVGFGIACRGTHVRLSEIYLARYVSVDPHPVTIKGRSRFMFAGRVLDRAYSVKSIDLFYEPILLKSELPALLEPGPCSLPNDREQLLPRLPEDTRYEDGSRGSVELHGNGKFRTSINASKKEPGIYTIVVWIQKQMGNPFPATQVCVRTE